MTYQLYFKKEECKLEVKPVSAGLRDARTEDEVRQYNNCYYVCNKRKPLIEKARELKEQWISEAQEQLDRFKNIEIR